MEHMEFGMKKTVFIKMRMAKRFVMIMVALLCCQSAKSLWTSSLGMCARIVQQESERSPTPKGRFFGEKLLRSIPLARERSYFRLILPAAFVGGWVRTGTR